MISPIQAITSLFVLATVANSAAIPSTIVPRATGKRGLGYNDASLCSQFSSGEITWGYDWAAGAASTVGKFEYVPMLWGEKTFADWPRNVKAALAKGAKHLLAFNEPDLPSQANMSPSAAAKAYITHMNPHAGSASLGAPAVSNSGSPNQGLDWLKQFLAECNGACKIDFVPIHWYDPTGGVEYFKKHMREAYAIAGKPIWLTEFGMWGASQEDQAKFFREVSVWMDQQDWLERYAYFGVFEGMMIQGGQLSTLGRAYNS